MNHLRRKATAVTAALIALTLTACGTTEAPITPANAAPSQAAESGEVGPGSSVEGVAGTSVEPAPGSETAGGSAASTGPITLTDGTGRTVKLNGPARRIVVLEWGEAEILAMLKAPIVGVAEIEGYNIWSTTVPLAADVKDVGTRSEPSTDAIFALEPDLVVVNGTTPGDQGEQLNKRVPVLFAYPPTTKGALDAIKNNVTLFAKATGTEAAGKKLVSGLDSGLAKGKQAIDKAGVNGSPFLMLDGWNEGSTVSIRPFGQGSIIAETLTAIGLKNAWTGKVDPQWGLGVTDVEGLTVMTDPRLRVFYTASEENVFTGPLAKNPIWTSLPFVKNKQITQFSSGTWMFGGPASVLSMVDQAVAAYAG